MTRDSIACTSVFTFPFLLFFFGSYDYDGMDAPTHPFLGKVISRTVGVG
ncbi:MAG: hypothetical protein ACFFB2_20445 [Promethearchaeota archaeon]